MVAIFYKPHCDNEMCKDNNQEVPPGTTRGNRNGPSSYNIHAISNRQAATGHPK